MLHSHACWHNIWNMIKEMLHIDWTSFLIVLWCTRCFWCIMLNMNIEDLSFGRLAVSWHLCNEKVWPLLKNFSKLEGSDDSQATLTLRIYVLGGWVPVSGVSAGVEARVSFETAFCRGESSQPSTPHQSDTEKPKITAIKPLRSAMIIVTAKI